MKITAIHRAYYSESIETFCMSSIEEITGILVQNNEFDLTQTQRDAWLYQICFLQEALKTFSGQIYFEYHIPRMGRRIDVLLIIKHVIFVIEFKVGDRSFTRSGIEQVWDYALDLKNFHESSHELFIAPILLASRAPSPPQEAVLSYSQDRVLYPILSNDKTLTENIEKVLTTVDAGIIDLSKWETGSYQPTPNIIEAALALYQGHHVENISRSDAGALSIQKISSTVLDIIHEAKTKHFKAICFITGVPGAGKTLVGLNIAAQDLDQEKELKGVYLSGNGPLVAVLREALARDDAARKRERNQKATLAEARRSVKAFIQNVHHFRDDCLRDPNPPSNRIAIFDEAQRAWDKEQTKSFMKNKKNQANFDQSEPEYLISCIDRHDDWGVVICLIGGGQEINKGEAGIGLWVECMMERFKDWHVYISDRLMDLEYGAGAAIKSLGSRKDVIFLEDLHLRVSMRSFRAETVSLWVKQVLDIHADAKNTYKKIKGKYPIVLCRDIRVAKKWLKEKARGSERYGLVASSQAYRLRPLAIDVRHDTDPIHWFLNEKDDVRSSYFLEDVATEFKVQGLELDWVCVTWDGDLRFHDGSWQYWSFKGDKWQNVRKEERRKYLINAYRVLLTRARQGMVILVPNGDVKDHTRKAEYYDETYQYLKSIGVEELNGGSHEIV